MSSTPITYDDKQVQACISAGQSYLEDLTPALQKSAGFMLKQIKAVFTEEGPGWEARDEASVKAAAERVKARGHQSLRTKLRRDVRRAKSRFAEGIGKKEALKKRRAVLGEFEKIARGETVKKSKLTEKQQVSLRSRLGRALEKSEKKGGKILGRLAGSIFPTVTSNSLTLTSRPEWSSIHNEGGTAGHGAQIPKRTFLEWTPERLHKIAQIIAYGFRDAWDKGGEEEG